MLSIPFFRLDFLSWAQCTYTCKCIQCLPQTLVLPLVSGSSVQFTVHLPHMPMQKTDAPKCHRFFCGFQRGENLKRDGGVRGEEGEGDAKASGIWLWCGDAGAGVQPKVSGLHVTLKYTKQVVLTTRQVSRISREMCPGTGTHSFGPIMEKKLRNPSEKKKKCESRALDIFNIMVPDLFVVEWSLSTTGG